MAQQLTLIVRAEDRASEVLRKLQLEVTATATTTSSADKATKALGKSAQTTSKSLNTMAVSSRRLITAIAGASVIYATIRGIRAATKEYVNYNKELHNVWTLTDYTGEKIEKLGNRVRHLAMDYDVTASESLKAMYQIYSATFYGESAFLILEESLKGAAAGLSDVFTVSDMMTTVLNAYNKEASETSHINDIMFTTIKHGKTTMHELAQQFGRLAAVAAPVGSTIEELSAAIATLTRRGLATDWAITSLRQSHMQLMRPSAELEKIIKKLGYSSGLAMLKEKHFSESLLLVKEEADKTGIGLEKLFSNVRAITAVLPLATDAAMDFATDQERMAHAAGAAEEAFRKQTESIAFQLGVLSTGLLDLGSVAAEVFMHDMALFIRDTLVPLVKTLAFWISKNREELMYFIKGFIKITAAVGLVYALYKSFTLLTKPIIWLIAAAYLLYAAWETNLFGIRELVGSIAPKLFAPITWGLEMLGQDDMANSVKAWAGENGLLATALLGAGAAGVGKLLFGMLATTMKAGVKPSGGVLKLLPIVAIAAMAWDITNSIRNITGGEGNTLDLITKILGGLLGGALALALGASAGVAIIAAGAGYAFAIGVQALMKVVWDVDNSIGDVSGDAVDKEYSGSAWNPANWIERLFDAGQGVARSADSALERAFGMNKGGFIPGTGSGDTVPAMLEPGEFVVPNWMMDIPWINEAIMDTWKTGRKMAAGGSVGFTAGSTGLSATVTNDLIKRMLEPMSTMSNQILGPLADFFTKHGRDTENVLELFTNLTNLIKSTDEAQAMFEDIIRGMDGYVDDINETSPDVTEALANFATSINDLLKNELVTGIRGILASILGMDEEAKDAAKSFNIPKLMKLTRAAWGVAVAGQPYSQDASEEESAWDRIANGILDAVALLLGSILWSEVITPVIWGEFISPITDFVWEKVLKPAGTAVWNAIGPHLETGLSNALSSASGIAALAGGLMAFVAVLTIEAAVVKLWADNYEGPVEKTGLDDAIVSAGGAGVLALLMKQISQVGMTTHEQENLASSINQRLAIGQDLATIWRSIDNFFDVVAGYDFATARPGNIPGLATDPGEYYGITKTGVATVHEGEVVGTPGNSGTYNYYVTLPSVTNAQEFADEMEKITKMKNLQETGNRHGSYKV